MTSESAMLNVNSTSRTIGGSGRTTIASTARTPIGTPTPVRIRSRIESRVEVVAVVAISVLGLIDRRVDVRRLRRLRAAAAGVLQLVDVGQNLSDSYVQRGGYLAAYLDAPEQRACERRGLEDRYEMLVSHFANTRRDQIGAFRHDDRSAHAPLVITQRYRIVSRVDDDDVRLRHLVHHSPLRDLALQVSEPALDLWGSLALLHLL